MAPEMLQSPANVNPTTGLLNGTFGIGTFAVAGRDVPGLVRPNGEGLDLSDRFPDTHAIFDDWERNFDRLVDIEAKHAGSFHLRDVRPRPPLSHPNLLCAGANYKQHSAEMLTKNKFNQHNRLPGETDDEFFKRNYALMERRAREGIPFLFAGLHSALVGANDDVILPVLGNEPDWELEFGAVVGKSGRLCSVEQAAGLVAGYVMVNDLGSVDIFRRTDIPWGYDWISKHQPTFKPAGPFIVPANFISVNDDIRIRLKVNGAIKQDWPVTDMVFNVPRLLAYASERVNLLPGDIIITGSPPGNGRHHGHFLKDGDLIESEITYLGRQRNRCVAERMPNRPLAFGLWKND